MWIAKTNIAYEGYSFDCGEEVKAPKDVIDAIKNLCDYVEDKEKPVVEEKAMKMEKIKDKKLKKYKNK